MIAWLLAGAAQAACTVIAGATVHTPDGPDDDATVVIVDERVAAVGRELRGLTLERGDQRRSASASYRTEPCRYVQGAGKHLSAGFVAAPLTLGLVEISLESGTRDDDAETDDAIRASLRVADAYDPRSSAVRVTRVEGITSAAIFPSGAFVPGFAGFVQLDGATKGEAVVSREAVLPIARNTGSLAEDIQRIRELVEDVKRYRRSRSTFESNAPYLTGMSRLDLQALQPVVEGRVPVAISANRASDIEAIGALKEDLGLDVVIFGAAEGWRHAEALAAAKIPVVVDPLVYGAGGFDQREGRADNAAILANAGVDVIITPGTYEAHNARVLRQVAGNAVRGGMTHEQAMASITEIPARVFGQPDRGRVANGAVADLALWSGDPLELSTSLEELWIGGSSVDLRTRQTELAKKYLELPGTPTAPLTVE